VELTETGQAIGERVSSALSGVEERVRARAGDEAISAFLDVLRILEEEIR
jgi:hypothetical protein